MRWEPLEGLCRGGLGSELGFHSMILAAVLRIDWQGRCGAGRARAVKGNCSNPRSKDKSHEPLAKVQARNDRGLHQIGSDREMVAV